MSLITVVAGLPGVGKTTFAKAYAKHLRAALVDRDTLMEPIVAAGLVAGGEGPSAYGSPLFLDTFNRPAYTAAETVAIEIATTAAVDVVLVAPYTRQAAEGRGWWDDLTGRADAAGVESRLLWLTLGRDEHRNRLAGRAAVIGGRDAHVLADFDRWWVAQHRIVPDYASPLRATLPVETLIALAGIRTAPLVPTG